MSPRLAIGPMSKNVVDACIEYANSRDRELILIPSRRQIDWDRGYVNGWRTETFARYVRDRSSMITLERDHGGPGQGDEVDDGIKSLGLDCQHFNLVHIDPWKCVVGLADAFEQTQRLIENCYYLNPQVQFEVGTEEAIFPYDAGAFELLLIHLRQHLPAKQYSRIAYAVIQSGTSLRENGNTGTYDSARLAAMLDVCKRFGVRSKEHNSDYLSESILTEKAKAGVSCFNVAPEFGKIETDAILEFVGNGPLFDKYYEICLSSNRWRKWVDEGFQPDQNRKKLVEICGHYVLSDYRVKEMIHTFNDFDGIVQNRVRDKIDSFFQCLAV